MQWLALPASAVALAAALACVAPASAATVARHDPHGDAPARYDLTKVTFTNTSTRLAFKAHVRGLQGARTQIYGMSISAAGTKNWYLDLDSFRRSNGKVHSVITGSTVDGITTTLCRPTVKWRLAKNVITASFPRTCMPDAGTLQVSAFTGVGNGKYGDPADWTKPFNVRQD